MQKNFKSIFLGLVLIGGLGMIGCQSIQDEDEVKELEKVKIEVPVNKDEKEDEETKQLSLEEARDIGQNWVRKNVGSDCDIQYEKFTQSEDKLVADVYQVGEIKLGFIEVVSVSHIRILLKLGAFNINYSPSFQIHHHFSWFLIILR